MHIAMLSLIPHERRVEEDEDWYKGGAVAETEPLEAGAEPATGQTPDPGHPANASDQQGGWPAREALPQNDPADD